AHAEYGKEFFKERKALQGLEKGRRKLHAAVDKVTSKRQRISCEDKNVSLNKKLQSVIPQFDVYEENNDH
ncbi:hypothetical protein BGZ80_001973, partial [Entomortierella chlamydospora]